MADGQTQTEHEHCWKFLRQEERKAYFGTGRLRQVVTVDVYFCERCLAYQEITVSTKDNDEYYGRMY